MTVEFTVIERTRSTVLEPLLASLPLAAREALDRLARGEVLDLDRLDPGARSLLRRSALVTADGTLGVPMLGQHLAQQSWLRPCTRSASTSTGGSCR